MIRRVSGFAGSSGLLHAGDHFRDPDRVQSRFVAPTYSPVGVLSVRGYGASPEYGDAAGEK
jgi:hypothetical protein